LFFNGEDGSDLVVQFFLRFVLLSIRGLSTEDLRILKEKLEQEVCLLITFCSIFDVLFLMRKLLDNGASCNMKHWKAYYRFRQIN